MSGERGVPRRTPGSNYMRSILCLSLWGACLWVGLFQVNAQDSAEQVEFFESQVRPLLVEHCFKCHGAEKQQSELRLDSREAVLKGGENGPALVPGQPESSRLVAAIRYSGESQMPPDGKLAETQIAVLEKWVAMGAPFPVGLSIPDVEKLAKQKSHWAFQPVKAVEPPAVKEREWCRTPVDQFVLAKLESQQLAHSAGADRRTLIRRVTYDLTGLPPTPEEVAAFVNDNHPDAYRQVVDRLLDSPHYGEQWARHWLDVARYSDTKGYVYAREERFWVHAPTYRDWVVQALNSDMPYDRFLAMQMAADLIAPDDKPNQAAMGFLTLGRRFLGITHDIYDDRIDVITRGTMGLTAACARCHDHKYDPIPTADYYALYGVFMNSHEELVPAAEPPEKSGAYLSFEEDLAEKNRKQSETFTQKRAEAAERIRSRLHDYFVAQTEITKYPQEGFDLILSTNDLIPAVVWRWEAYVATEIQLGNPVFIPWQMFAELQPNDFTAQSPVVLKRLSEPAAGQPLANSLVLAALAPPPGSMKEVTERYAKLLAEIDKAWTESIESAKSLGSPLPNGLPEPDAEALRQVLYGPASPCLIYPESILSTEIYYDSGSVDELWKLHNEIDRSIINHPLALPHAVVLKERPTVRPNRMLRRGNPATKVGFVDRHFLTLIAGPEPKPFTQGSGRRELAEAIISPTNPLTARVWVNRLWQHHLGTGLVRTPSDFGIRAETPSHPELLDWLATQLISSGWSTKTIHRLIVLSNTYKQASSGPADAETRERADLIDPENRLLWRMNVHRLTWEEFRDTLLITTGQLDRKLGGRSVDLFAGGGSTNRRRTLYGTVDRQFLPSTLRMFDFANPDLHIPARSETTVPQQALFSLNHPLMAEKARALVSHAGLAEENDPTEKLARLYRSALQREPTPTQCEVAIAFLSTAAEPPPAQQSAASTTWSYGYGELDETTAKLKSFSPLPHFNGTAWQGGTNWPDTALGWAQLTARGGHPGNDLQHATIRRWTAPRAGTFAVTSSAIHEVEAGDGIRCWIVSNKGGILAKAALHHQTVELNVSSIVLELGDTLDFIVDLHANLNSEQHFWSPVISEVASTNSATPNTWDAARDFSGSPPVLMTNWEQLAQVLLLSNELMFVD